MHKNLISNKEADLFELNFFKYLLLISFVCFGFNQAQAQEGITVSPSRLYFEMAPSVSASKELIISNPSQKRPLEIGVSLADWSYDTVGNNISSDPGTLPNSCSKWIQVLPGSYFTLAPGETRTINIKLTPATQVDEKIPVRTSMLYLTQLNPATGKNARGASIAIAVRMGVKIYYAFPVAHKKAIDITNFLVRNSKQEGLKDLVLKFDNIGNYWIEGKVSWELLNKETGKKTKLEEESFYSLPGDHRILIKQLPKDLAPGSYTATAVVNFGERDELKLAELDFQY